MIIWLQGPSGAGKSTAGRELAALRGVPFVDLDAEIERAQGRSILDIFWSDGEAAFRGMEWNALLELMDRDRAPKVIALGGGAVADAGVRGMMRGSGVRVFLDVDPDVAIERLQADTPRPLLYEDDPAAKWRKLYNARRRHYEEADVTVRSDADPAAVARSIDAAVNALSVPRWREDAEIGGEGSAVLGFGALYVLARHLRELAAGRDVCMVVDRAVSQYYADYLFPDDAHDGIVTLVQEPGEERKTLADLEAMARGLVDAGFTRECLIVAIGGGVVTDMAGFLAAVYMRGVRAVYVPTTLLAQVDASVGGKTAVNAAGIRNLLGAFKQPEQVLLSPAFLRSLPARELRSGFVESLKMGIINEPELDAAVRVAESAAAAGEIPENIEEVVRLSVRAKLAVVRRDAHDAGLRLSLNYGHTFGHALEAAEPGVYAHGEAVAFGMIAAAELAHSVGAISAARCAAIRERSLPFTLADHAPRNPAALLRAMASDKKRAGSGIRFVLPGEETGHSLFTTDDDALILRAIGKACSDEL